MTNNITKNSLNLLRYIKQQKYITVEQADAFTGCKVMFNPYLKELNDNGLIKSYDLTKLTISQNGIAYLEQIETKKEERKAAYTHDWRIAVFSSIFGAIAGFVTSLIFWLITK